MSGQTTILLVDDDDIMRDGIKLMLRKSGCKFIEAADYYEAEEKLAAAAKNGPTITAVITDFNYPGPSGNAGGADLVKLLNDQYPDLLVAVITGMTQDFLRKARENSLKYDQFFSKPLAGIFFARDVMEWLSGPARRNPPQAPVQPAPAGVR